VLKKKWSATKGKVWKITSLGVPLRRLEGDKATRKQKKDTKRVGEDVSWGRRLIKERWGEKRFNNDADQPREKKDRKMREKNKKTRTKKT